ncbi:hypothetical protein E4U40_002547 [Claviceps sp. LM458 group G5]|nr:hypothetical protein E4U40_002547 [Claviceps sp. LM458 group G5]
MLQPTTLTTTTTVHVAKAANQVRIQGPSPASYRSLYLRGIPVESILSSRSPVDPTLQCDGRTSWKWLEALERVTLYRRRRILAAIMAAAGLPPPPYVPDALSPMSLVQVLSSCSIRHHGALGSRELEAESMVVGANNLGSPQSQPRQSRGGVSLLASTL